MLEVASRVEDKVSYGMPLMSRIQTSNDLVLRDTIGARGRPNAVFRRWKLDSLGFRGPDISVTPPPGVVRIVTTGASETFGLYEAANKEYPRQLEDSLRARVAASCPDDDAPKVEVKQAHTSAELFEQLTGTAVDSPLCMTCGTKMRPAGSCYVCEGCGSTSGCS